MSMMITGAVLLLCSCSAWQAADSHQPISGAENRASPPHETQPLNDPINTGFFNGTPEGEKNAWLSFIQNGKYQIAQTEDFHFPPRAEELQGNDVEKARKRPYVGGDINRDGLSNDFAVIIVDRSMADSLRFSLIIFTQPSDKSRPYRQDFLYSRRDLSKTLLEWWSGGLAVREYFDDGSYRYCYVKWDKSQGKYYCKEEP